MSRLFRFGLALSLFVSVGLPMGSRRSWAAARNGSTTVRLQRIAPSPQLLQAPEGLEQGFTVAREAPLIDFAIYPGQFAGAKLWSSWGDALYVSDGKFYTSIGDHDSPHGTAYVYRIDPQTRRLTRIVDYNAVVGIPGDKYTPGKIHGGLVDGGDGWIYMFGYRGNVRLTTAEKGYRGDWLLRYEMATGKTENLGIPLADCGVPCMKGHPKSHSLYGLAAWGMTMPEPRINPFFHYDLQARKVVYCGGPDCGSPRAIIVAEDGRVYYSRPEGASGKYSLARYDSKSRRVETLGARLPGEGFLRAASRPDADGVAYCFTTDGTIFAFDTRTEKITEMMKAFVGGPLYTATCRLDSAGKYLYYVPGAHGGTHQAGTPVIQLDVKRRRLKVIAFLNAHFRREKQYNLGGTYGIALDADGSRLLISFNGAPLEGAKHKDFGFCSAVILHLPEAERK